MNMSSNNNNGFVVTGLSQEQLAKILLAAGHSEVKIAPAKKVKVVDNIVYTDEAKTTGVCKCCKEEFVLSDYTAEELADSYRLGLCPKCAAQFAKFKALDAQLKSEHISGTRQVINGGQQVGQRLKAAFAEALKSENLTQEILDNWQDLNYTRKNLKFSSYPFLTNVTNVTDEEQKMNKTYYKRFYSTPYSILNGKYRLNAQITATQLTAAINEFKRLNLIAENSEF